MPVLCLAFVFISFLAVCVDGMVLLLKKISTGYFDSHFGEMDEGMRGRAFLPCILLGSTIFPTFFTVTTVLTIGHKISLYLGIIALVAHTLYRTLVVLSDIAARKYPIADNDMSRKKARTGRRWAFLILGFFAILIAVIITLIIRGILPTPT